jgi:hypothetical protein
MWRSGGHLVVLADAITSVGFIAQSLTFVTAFLYRTLKQQ